MVAPARHAKILFKEDKRRESGLRWPSSTKNPLQLQIMVQKMAAYSTENSIHTKVGGYYEAAKYCLKLKEQKIAHLWTEKMLEVDLYCVGDDHPEYRKTLTTAQVMRRAVSLPEPISESTLEWFMKD
ncbi:hypothetical protein N7447_006288 [Penicillium robsamsonii]|uniref:uncharacterized protein n=1 Tax=Penicillium robsamsonii TaxID=1792511 RepID=UPI002546C7D5|nr:uncharacterized protein N7447_006288 [Penicillium robsamsonii]KAJ5823948.1 hypothetical protein N7447_006288 [Penicillium robsamsonii]